MSKINDYRLLEYRAEPLLNEITALGCRIFNVRSCFVSVIDKGTQWFTARCGLDLDSTPADISFCQHVLKQAKPLIIEDARQDPRFSSNPLVVGAPEIRFYAGMPLYLDQELVGTFCLVDPNPRGWTAAEHELLLHLSQLFAQSIQLNFTHHLAEDEHQLLNHAPAALMRWALTPTMTLQFVSENFFPLFGVHAKQLQHTSWRLEAHIAPSDLNNYLFTLQNHKQGARHCETEYRIIAESGQTQWVKQISTGHYDQDGKLTAINALLLKNSRQKYLDKQLQSNNERMRLMLEAAELATWDWDIQTDVSIYNKRWCMFLGLDSDFVDPSSVFWEKLIHPADLQKVRSTLNEHLAGNTPNFSCQYRMQHADGHWLWIDTYAKVVGFCQNGKPARLTGIHRDISIQKQAEIQKEKQQALMQLLNKAQMVFIDRLDLKVACLEIFEDLLQLAESDFGFIGHVQYAEQRQRLHIVALTDISWNGDSAGYFKDYKENKLYFDNLDNLFGHVVTSGQEVLSNQPRQHPASRGTPTGHPNIIRFMGLPIKSRNGIIGMIGLANKATDYSHENALYLQPLLDTLGALFYAVESEQARKLAEERLVIQAATDPLTGLANRRAFIELAHQYYYSAQPGFMAIIDIDYFKKINDTFGHHVGDQVLQHLAEHCQSLLRTDDLLARLGGEEFGLILNGNSVADASKLLENINLSVASLNWAAIAPELTLTISIGAVARMPTSPELVQHQFEQDMIRADQALYQAKQLGRNKLIFAASMEK